MPTMRITNNFARRAKCTNKRRTDYFDTIVPGFVLEVRRTGGATFYARYRDAAGNQCSRRIGAANKVTADEARELARIIIRDQDIPDPAVLRKPITFAAYLKDIFLPHQQEAKRSWVDDLNHIENHLIPFFGHGLLLSQVTRELILQFRENRRLCGRMASTCNNHLATLRYALDLAVDWGYLRTTPARNVRNLEHHPRADVHLKPDELQRLCAAVNERGGPHFRFIIAMLIFTGARKNEVLQARWQDIDLGGRRWRISLRPPWRTGEALMSPEKERPDWPERDQHGHARRHSQLNIWTYAEWRGHRARHDAFAGRNEVTLASCDKWVTLDDDMVRRLWLDADRLGLHTSKDFFRDVILDFCKSNSHHPVVTYLAALTWDGVPRLDTWLTVYANAEDTSLHRAFGRKTLIAAVRRVRCPGSKHDVCLVLEGPQNEGKSSMLRVLAGDVWFTDSLRIGSDPKETIENTRGKWICELSELAGMGKAGRERVKAFLSSQVDHAALKYEALGRDFPRQFICIGTVNHGQFLDDPTGNRRFWPVVVSAVDLSGLRRDRDQLWAEAAIAEQAAESTELPTDLWVAARQAQQGRMMDDPFYDRLQPVLDGKVGAVSREALWNFLGIPLDKRDRHAAARLTETMQRLSFSPSRRRGDGSAAAGGKPSEGQIVPCYLREGWTGERLPWILLVQLGQ